MMRNNSHVIMLLTISTAIALLITESQHLSHISSNSIKNHSLDLEHILTLISSLYHAYVSHSMKNLAIWAIIFIAISRSRSGNRNHHILAIYIGLMIPSYTLATCQSGWISAGDVCVPCAADTFASSASTCSQCPSASYSDEMSLSCLTIPNATFVSTEIDMIAGPAAATGAHVAIHKNIAVIGYPFEDKAYIYERDTTSGTWNQTATLAQSATSTFGHAVAVNGDTDLVLVGAHKFNSHAGSVFVFERIAGNWTRTGTLVGGGVSSGDYYGFSISISGDIVAAGGYNDDGATGSVFVFERNAVIGWQQKTRLIAPNAGVNKWFGHSVAISGAYIAVGSPYAGAGSVYVYKRTSQSAWTYYKTLAVSGSSGLGWSVDMCGVYIVAGSPLQDTNAGAAYVFDGSASWSNVKISAPTTSTNDRFGSSVAIDGDTIIVGAPFDANPATAAGSVHVFGRDGTRRYELAPSMLVGNGHFGMSVALNAPLAIVGSDDAVSIFGCADGEHADESVCRDCPPGFTCPRGSIAPIPCVAGWYSSGGIGACIHCDDGMYSNDSASTCSHCLAGYYCLLNSSAPLPCPPGTYSTHGSSNCTTCPTSGVSGTAAPYCTCSAGTASGATIATKSIPCLSCSPGQYSMAGDSVCTDSPPGQYAAATNTGPSLCSVGKYSAAAQTSCDSCPIGSYQPIQGQSLCMSCPLGHICPTVGMSVASPCAPDTTTHTLNSTICDACPFIGNCLGGGQCAMHHRGNLCGSCVARYYMKGITCEKCPDVPVLLIIAVVFAVLLLVLLVLLRVPPKWIITGRLLIAFIQSFQLSLSIDITWPPFIIWLRRILSLFYFDIELMSPECIFTGFTWYHRFWAVIIAASSVPILLLVLVLLVSFMRKSMMFFMSKWSLFLLMMKIEVRFARSIFTVFTLSFVPVTKMAVTSFVCVPAGNDMVLKDDTSIRYLHTHLHTYPHTTHISTLIFSCSDPHLIAIQIFSAFLLALFSVLGPIFLAMSTLYDIYIRGNTDATFDTIFLTDRLSSSFRARKWVQMIGWCFIYPIYLLGFWMIPLIRNGSRQSDGQKWLGYRQMDKRQVLGVAYEAYHPQFPYFEAVLLAKKAIFIVLAVSTITPLAHSIALSLTSTAYLALIILTRPFVPLPIHAIQHQKLAVNVLNIMEMAWSSCVLLINIIPLLMVSFGAELAVLQILASVIGGISGVLGLFIIIIPIMVKNQQVKQQDVNVDFLTTLNLDMCRKGREKLPAHDERSLLGYGDGLWLQSLEKMRKEVLEGEMAVSDKVELAGACTIWIDRLIGRLEARYALMSEFHPSLEAKQRQSVRNMHVGDRSDVIDVENLKFRDQRKSVMARMGLSAVRIDVPDSSESTTLSRL